jgi:hypothetical protein
MLRRLKRLLPSGVAARRVLRGPAKGATALIDFRFDTAFYFGLHERELHSHYRRLVQPGMQCFDVGGYRGWDAIGMSVLSGANVISFECNTENASYIASSSKAGGHKIQVDARFVAAKSDAGAVSLDEATQKWFIPDVVKMDIEGKEYEALCGGVELLKSHRPNLIIEVHGTEVEDACHRLLVDIGYTPIVVDQRYRMLREARAAFHNRWLICDSND